MVVSTKSSASWGVCILFRATLDFTMHDYIVNTEGSCVISDISIASLYITWLANINTPKKDRERGIWKMICKVYGANHTWLSY